jgi:hypothetical protein
MQTILAKRNNLRGAQESVKIQKIKLVKEPTQPRGLAFAGFALDAESVSKALENTEIAYLTVTTTCWKLWVRDQRVMENADCGM